MLGIPEAHFGVSIEVNGDELRVVFVPQDARARVYLYLPLRHNLWHRGLRGRVTDELKIV